MAENQQPNWQNSIEDILHEHVKENKKRRRWGIFFKSIASIYFLVFFIMLIMPGLRASSRLTRPHASLVDISGAIMPGSINSADNVVSSLSKAFKDPNTKGIILRINSPGGAPVQASDIYNAIFRLRKKYPNKKVYAVCSDFCASAAYYVAAATNDVYANPSSLVGSIGVLLNGFGFTGAMEKLGVSRRLITSGDEKGFLDPFSPLKPQNKAYAKKMLNIVHQQFINDVKKGRGKRLHITPDLFSGLIWTGVQAKKMGLIDGFGSAAYVAQHVIGTKNVVNYTKKRGFIQRLSRNMGASFSHGILSTLIGSRLQ